MNDQPNIAIIILAAGASTRMGSPKQLLTWGNTTLLNHTIEQAINSKSDAVYVVLGANYTAIKKSIIHKQATLLHFKNWKEGMGSSIMYGMQNLPPNKFDGVLVMLADQPQIDTSFLNKLISQFYQKKLSIISTQHKHGSGVPAIFANSYFKKLLRLRGDEGAKQIIANSMDKVLALSPFKIIEDIDTMETYFRLLKTR